MALENEKNAVLKDEPNSEYSVQSFSFISRKGYRDVLGGEAAGKEGSVSRWFVVSGNSAKYKSN